MIEPKELLSIITDGDEEQFLREHWRRRTLIAKGCFPGLKQYYSGSQFLEDYRRLNFHGATYLIVIGEGNRRQFIVPEDWTSVEKALEHGTPMALLALNLPEGRSQRPVQWDQFISLQRSIREYLCEDFPAPPAGQSDNYFAVAAVDFFYNSASCAQGTTGGHYDTSDVFYFVLEGEKSWTVELGPDFETAKSLLTLPGGMRNLSNADLRPRRECIEVTLIPGDCIYVPPFTYHRVTSKGSNLAVSLGIPTFNEVTLLAYSLVRLQSSQELYHPLPCFPRTFEDLHTRAYKETRSRMQGVITALSDAFRS
jgi:ribosomal protein L16 Arg81 hydroxylase